MTRLGLLAAFLLAPSMAAANGSGAQDPSDLNRIRGARELVRMGDGLVSLGARKLRYLAPGGDAWEVLHERRGELSGAAVDPVGRRVLAWWENDLLLQYAKLRPAKRAGLRFPEVPPPEGLTLSLTGINYIRFAPNGRDALVYVYGSTGMTGSRGFHRAFRVPLSGKPPPSLLYHLDNAIQLAASPYGSVYLLGKSSGQDCGHPSCIPGRLVIHRINDEGWTEVTLADAADQPFSGAEVMAGSDDERLLLRLARSGPGDLFIMVRWRDTSWVMEDRPSPKLDGEVVLRTVSPTSEELVTVAAAAAGRFTWLRQPLPGREVPAPVPAVPPAPPPTVFEALSASLAGGPTSGTTMIGKQRYEGPRWPRHTYHAAGLRADGSAWVHRNDELLLIALDGTARVVDLRALVGGKPEWAGAATYAPKPESLWVGVEVGSYRDFVRVLFSELEKAGLGTDAAKRVF